MNIFRWTFICHCAAAFGVVAVASAASRPSETLFPETTDVWFSVANIESLEKHWDQTQLGRLMANPIMAPFTRHLSWQFEDEWSGIEDRLTLTLSDIRRVAGGETAIGRIGRRPGRLALCAVIDISGRLSQARRVLREVDRRQLERGATRHESEVDGHAVFGYSSVRRQPRFSAGTDAIATGGPETAYYCVTGDLLVASDDLDALKGILNRASGNDNKPSSLASYVPFETVMLRCELGGGADAFQIRWFLNARAAASGDRDAKAVGKATVGREIATSRGVGGLIAFSMGGHQISHRTAVYAPRPIKALVTAAALPSQPDFTPQAWVPQDISTYTTLYVDLTRDFEAIGPAADKLFGHDAAGTWREIVDSLEHDPNGPRIDVREDLVSHLGPRVTFLTDYREPITTTSNRLLIAIETKDAQAVRSALRRLLANDPTIRNRNERGIAVWELAPKKRPGLPPKIGFGDAPPLTRPEPLRKKSDKESGRLLPEAAITVWNGNLMIASHVDYLLKVVAPSTKQPPLAADPVYRLVQSEINKSPAKGECLQFFSRTDEEYRPTYELVRQNEVPQGESMADRAIGLLFAKRHLAIKPAKFDGSRLPEYEKVRPYLGPAGLRITRELQGWFAEGFTLTKAPIVATSPRQQR
ncbi:MAG: hypothetical protein LLG00_01465 [Planctomycetaceae bacterium]|nr:hypothetical protein [Planctomycetaceae bacterium]